MAPFVADNMHAKLLERYGGEFSSTPHFADLWEYHHRVFYGKPPPGGDNLRAFYEPPPGAVYFDGANAGKVTTADKAQLDITGDIDIIVNLCPNGRIPAAQTVIVSKFGDTAQLSFAFGMLQTTGRPYLTWTPDGATSRLATCTADIPVDFKFTDTFNRSNRAIDGDASDTGQVWQGDGVPSGAAMSIVSNKLVNPLNDRGYASVDVGTDFDTYLAVLTWESGSTAAAAAAPLISPRSVSLGFSGEDIALASNHWGVFQASHQLNYFDGIGGFSGNALAGAHTSMTADGSTASIVEIIQQGDRQYAFMNGTRALAPKDYRNWVHWGRTIVAEASRPPATVATDREPRFDSVMAYNSRIWLRATLDVTNGSQYEAKFWYSFQAVGTDPALLSWTQLGSTITGATGPTSILSSTAPLTIGQTDIAAAPLRYSGRVFRAIVKRGIGGTTVADFNARTLSDGDTSYADGLGNTWSLTGAGVDTATWAPRTKHLPDLIRRYWEEYDGANT